MNELVNAQAMALEAAKNSLEMFRRNDDEEQKRDKKNRMHEKLFNHFVQFLEITGPRKCATKRVVSNSR